MSEKTSIQSGPEHSSYFEPNLRQSKLLKMILAHGFAETELAAKKFGKTTQTIRRDFDILEKHGLIRRVHGGASAIQGYENRSYRERLASRSGEKNLIGRTTAALIPHDKCIFLSLGTSTEAVARHLTAHKNMQFVTNNLNIAHVLQDTETSELTLCGGHVRRQDGGMLGPRAIDMIAEHRFDFGIIGAGAITSSGSLFSYSLNEARMAQAIIAQSDVTILVADEKKIGKNANHKMATLEDVEIFVTDDKNNILIGELCKQKNVKLIIAA